MTLTLLLDLDDTLLSNDIDTFVPAYLQQLSENIASLVAPDQLIRHLLRATKAMIDNNTPERSLEQAFDQVFYPAIGKSKAEMRPVLETFYTEVFPRLQPLTSPRPAAVDLVNWAASRGHIQVVATNPIFPRQAIQHRVQWAGFDPHSAPFALITDYEAFHFAKPNPAYITEILAQLGWPPQPAVMIGNSLTDDIAPAVALGLPVFWIQNGAAGRLPEGCHPLSASGSVEDVPTWVEQVDAAGLRPAWKSPGAVLAILKSTPAALDTWARSIDPAAWHRRPAPDEWNLTEILCHLRDVDREVNLPRLERVISGETPFLPGINTDRWAGERQYNREDGAKALQGFRAARLDLLNRLELLSGEGWQQTARHAIFGPTTLVELAGFISTHDTLHIQQIAAILRA
jgi:FMN phosphatase YigB (HAD superfamily)